MSAAKPVKMLVSVSFEVKFRVHAKTRAGEVVCVAGNLPQLGEWNPHRALVLKRETRKKVNLDTDTACFEENSEDGDVWSKVVHLHGTKDFQYRYFICRLFASDSEEDGEHGVLVKFWEGHVNPRVFCLKEAMDDLENNVVHEPDVFGNSGGIKQINRGWLTNHDEIQLQIHSDNIKMWKPHYREQTYSIKCTPMDHSYKEVTDDQYEQEVLGDSLPVCTRTEIWVSVLEPGRSKPVPQKDYGAVYHPGNFMTFHARTFDMESVGFQLDFYVHTSDNPPKHVGSCFLLPFEPVTSLVQNKKVPITGHKNRPIGQITLDYMIAKRMSGAAFSMKRTYQKYWKSTRQAVDVGHRGLGVSYKLKKLALVRENTVKSLQSAAAHGADFVEFDVQLTKDEVPVIYHDFKVLITYRKKKREDLELFEIPVKDLTLSELQQMKLSHMSYQPEYKYEDIQEDDVDPEDVQPFPTLKRVFETVDIHTGFNVEVKFPLPKVTGDGKIFGFFDMNRYVDIILKVVFENHNGRRIIFSSFDPDCCTLLRLKQNVYPVLFLTQADSPRWSAYEGPRAHTIPMAIEFAISAGLLGVDVVCDVLLRDMSCIKYAKEAGLVVFVWGEDCNSKENIQKLKEHKVDGIIYDRIDFYKTGGKESIFKIEHKRKVALLKRMGSIMPEEEEADSGSEST